MANELDEISLIEALRGEKCVCGKRKGSMKSFCGGCYAKLPPEMRKAMYKRVGSGYEQAFATAIDALGISDDTLRTYLQECEL